jgi:hypothetical protein
MCFAASFFRTTLRRMRMFALVLAGATTLQACHPRQASDVAHDRALKSADEARARRNAEQDAVQAQRQIDLVTERTKNAGRQSGPASTDTQTAPKLPSK